MRVGFIGLGKLGMPVATVMQMAGHDVMGYDTDPQRREQVKEYPWTEAGAPPAERYGPDWRAGISGLTFQQMLERHPIKWASGIRELVEHAELIFVAVQTPHGPMYEGRTPLSTHRADFDYSYLRSVLIDMADAINKRTCVAVISTVAPGTFDDELKPILSTNPNVRYVYNPYFIAMGTVIADMLAPEFVLIGGEDNQAADCLQKFYSTLHSRPCRRMTIPSAEIVKMAYNTFITAKITFANSLMEMAHIFGGNVDDVTDALKAATDRLISKKYLTAGMGDGGGCHPRDNIVLSHLAREHGMSCDFAGAIMECRDRQAQWLAELMCREAYERHLHRVAVLGTAFKPETNLETGSPALLVASMIHRYQRAQRLRVETADPVIDPEVFECTVALPGVFLIGCRHEVIRHVRFRPGSVVIDPHRYIEDQEGVTVIRVGDGPRLSL
jgi:UDPglucose 6-dehydrogenase